MAPMSVTGCTPLAALSTRAHPRAARTPLYGNSKRGRQPSYGHRCSVNPPPTNNLSACAYDPAEGVTLQPYGYTGRRYDAESGLWYFRARYYDADLGRFISRDPIRYASGMNMYAGYFVPDALDPSGLVDDVRMEGNAVFYQDEGFMGWDYADGKKFVGFRDPNTMTVTFSPDLGIDPISWEELEKYGSYDTFEEFIEALRDKSLKDGVGPGFTGGAHVSDYYQFRARSCDDEEILRCQKDIAYANLKWQTRVQFGNTKAYIITSFGVALATGGATAASRSKGNVPMLIAGGVSFALGGACTAYGLWSASAIDVTVGRRAIREYCCKPCNDSCPEEYLQ